MEFARRKLHLESAMELKRCPIESVSPYAPMPSPIYIFMRSNAKFIAVKAPLDFFEPAELEKLRSFQDFYVPSFIDEVLPFKSAAQSVKAILRWQPRVVQDPSLKFSVVPLPPTPYEVSDALLRSVTVVWGAELEIEPFFLTVFSTELCGPMTADLMSRGREGDIDLFETALLRSGLAVFLALHLGSPTLESLHLLREGVFKKCIFPLDPVPTFTEEWTDLVTALIPSSEEKLIQAPKLFEINQPLAQKIHWRMERVKMELKRDEGVTPSIFGPKGFRDV